MRAIYTNNSLKASRLCLVLQLFKGKLENLNPIHATGKESEHNASKGWGPERTPDFLFRKSFIKILAEGTRSVINYNGNYTYTHSTHT